MKTKTYLKMPANDRKSYLGYLDKLATQNNNTHHRFIGKKPVDSDFSALTKQIQSNDKAPKFKVGSRVRITKDKSIFTKDCNENWSNEITVICSVLEANPWTYKIKDLNGQKIIRSFCEKQLLLSKL